MITPQDIREKTFEKAVFGGYDMGTVDGFLEEIAGDLALLQKENAVLKGKMKVLVDKVEEYRENEDALRTAVLSAQRLGMMIEKEAREKADAIVSNAEAEAERITREANADVEVERTRLAESKNASAKFLDSMDMLCRRQLEFLQKIGEMDFVREIREEPAQPQSTPVQAQPQAQVQAAPVQAAPEESAEVHETVKSIEETVAKVLDEPVISVRPAIQNAAAEDERPTKPFNIITDPEDDLDKTTQFSLEDFTK